MSRHVVYTLHLWPPLGHAAHYTGTTPERRLGQRLTDHALGRGARLTQVQVERGGFWVLAQTQPGGRGLERRLKQHGAARRCEVCKAVSAIRPGNWPRQDALAALGGIGRIPAQRSMLLDIFGLPEAPPALAAAAPDVRPAPEPVAWHSFIPAPRPPGEPEPWPWGKPAPADPVLDAAVAELERSWRAPELTARPPPEPELQAGL